MKVDHAIMIVVHILKLRQAGEQVFTNQESTSILIDDLIQISELPHAAFIGAVMKEFDQLENRSQ